MKTLKTFVTISFSFLLVHCAPFGTLDKVNPEQSKLIEKSKPKNLGSSQLYSYGMFDCRVFKYSVTVRPTSGASIYTEIEVHDLNRNERFDSVWAKNQDGKWYFGTTLGSEYRLMDNSLPRDVINDYLNLASKAKDTIVRRAQTEAKLNKVKEEVNKHAQEKLDKTKEEWSGARDYYRYNTY